MKNKKWFPKIHCFTWTAFRNINSHFLCQVYSLDASGFLMNRFGMVSNFQNQQLVTNLNSSADFHVFWLLNFMNCSVPDEILLKWNWKIFSNFADIRCIIQFPLFILSLIRVYFNIKAYIFLAKVILRHYESCVSGWSSAPAKQGFNLAHTARIFKTLMQERLGFKKFYIQGGDWGSLICHHMAVLYPSRWIYVLPFIFDMNLSSIEAKFFSMINPIFT